MFLYLVVQAEVHASDLVDMPVYVRKTPTRKAPSQPPSWHLTSPETLKYIEEADERAKEKEIKQEKLEIIKEEAVKEAKKKERLEKRKATGPPSGPLPLNLH